MSQLYEYQNTAFGYTYSIYGDRRAAQTFTPTRTHTIASVKLRLYRYGLPGTVTISIRETDDDGHPVGADLCSGQFDGDTLSSTNWEWREISLDNGPLLKSWHRYAIVVQGGTDNENSIRWSESTYDAYVLEIVEE